MHDGEEVRRAFWRSSMWYCGCSMAGPIRPSLSATAQASVICAALHSLVPLRSPGSGNTPAVKDVLTPEPTCAMTGGAQAHFPAAVPPLTSTQACHPCNWVQCVGKEATAKESCSSCSTGEVLHRKG